MRWWPCARHADRTPKSQVPAGSTRGAEHPSAQRPMLLSWWCLVARGLCLHPRAGPPLQKAGAPELPGEARGSCSVHTACSASATSRARSSSDTWPSAACEPGGDRPVLSACDSGTPRCGQRVLWPSPWSPSGCGTEAGLWVLKLSGRGRSRSSQAKVMVPLPPAPGTLHLSRIGGCLREPHVGSQGGRAPQVRRAEHCGVGRAVEYTVLLSVCHTSRGRAVCFVATYFYNKHVCCSGC